MEELLFLDGRKDHNMASIVLKNPAGLSPVAFAFEIFRDRVGHWCARRTDGKVGGTFLSATAPFGLPEESVGILRSLFSSMGIHSDVSLLPIGNRRTARSSAGTEACGQVARCWTDRS